MGGGGRDRSAPQGGAGHSQTHNHRGDGGGGGGGGEGNLAATVDDPPNPRVSDGDAAGHLQGRLRRRRRRRRGRGGRHGRTAEEGSSVEGPECAESSSFPPSRPFLPPIRSPSRRSSPGRRSSEVRSVECRTPRRLCSLALPPPPGFDRATLEEAIAAEGDPASGGATGAVGGGGGSPHVRRPPRVGSASSFGASSSSVGGGGGESNASATTATTTTGIAAPASSSTTTFAGQDPNATVVGGVGVGGGGPPSPFPPLVPRAAASPAGPRLAFGSHVLVPTVDGRLCAYEIYDFEDDFGRGDGVDAGGASTPSFLCGGSASDRDGDGDFDDPRAELERREELKRREERRDAVEPVRVVGPLGSAGGIVLRRDDDAVGRGGGTNASSDVWDEPSGTFEEGPTIVDLCSTERGVSLVNYRLVGGGRGRQILNDDGDGRTRSPPRAPPLAPEGFVGHVATLSSEGDVHVLEFVAIPPEVVGGGGVGGRGVGNADEDDGVAGKRKEERSSRGAPGLSVKILHSFSTEEADATCICLHESPLPAEEDRFHPSAAATATTPKMRICVGHASGSLSDFEVTSSVRRVPRTDDDGPKQPSSPSAISSGGVEPSEGAAQSIPPKPASNSARAPPAGGDAKAPAAALPEAKRAAAAADGDPSPPSSGRGGPESPPATSSSSIKDADDSATRGRESESQAAAGTASDPSAATAPRPPPAAPNPGPGGDRGATTASEAPSPRPDPARPDDPSATAPPPPPPPLAARSEEATEKAASDSPPPTATVEGSSRSSSSAAADDDANRAASTAGGGVTEPPSPDRGPARAAAVVARPSEIAEDKEAEAAAPPPPPVERSALGPTSGPVVPPAPATSSAGALSPAKGAAGASRDHGSDVPRPPSPPPVPPPHETSDRNETFVFGRVRSALKWRGTFGGGGRIESVSSLGFDSFSRGGADDDDDDGTRRAPYLAVSIRLPSGGVAASPLPPSSSSSSLEVVNVEAAEQEWNATVDERREEEDLEDDHREEEQEQIRPVLLDPYCLWPEAGMEVAFDDDDGPRRRGRRGRPRGLGGDKLCAFHGREPALVTATADGTIAISHSFRRRDAAAEGISWGLATDRNRLVLSEPCAGVGTFDGPTTEPTAARRRRRVACCLRGGTAYVAPVAPPRVRESSADRLGGGDDGGDVVTAYPCPVDPDGKEDGAARFVQGFAAGLARVKRWEGNDPPCVLPLLVYSWTGGIVDVYACALNRSSTVCAADEKDVHDECLIDALIENGTAKLLFDLLASMDENDPQLDDESWKRAWKECSNVDRDGAETIDLCLEELLGGAFGNFRSILLMFAAGGGG